jgi:outer membrane protein assembly factor BamA
MVPDAPSRVPTGYDPSRYRSGAPVLPFQWGPIQPDISLSHNRVDGIAAGVGVNVENPFDVPATIGLSHRYAFGSERNLYTVAVEIPNRMSWSPGQTGLSLYRMTASYESQESKLTTLENTMASIVFREDFFDYYEREGFAVWNIFNLTEGVEMAVELRREELRSPETGADWSIFKNDHDFRENPTLGYYHSGKIYLSPERKSESVHVFFTRDSRSPYVLEGWYVRISIEAGRAVGDTLDDNEVVQGSAVLDYRKYSVDARRYLPVGEKGNLTIRFATGLASGRRIPTEKLFYLGGVGSLRGYDEREFVGHSMLMANVEFRYQLSKYVDVVLFGDTGDAWYSDTGFSYSDLNSNIGLALVHQFSESSLAAARLSVAQQINVSDPEMKITFRLATPF